MPPQIYFGDKALIPQSNFGKNGISRVFFGSTQIIGQLNALTFNVGNARTINVPSLFTNRFLFSDTSPVFFPEEYGIQISDINLGLESESYYTGSFSASIILFDTLHIELMYTLNNSRYGRAHSLVDASGSDSIYKIQYNMPSAGHWDIYIRMPKAVYDSLIINSTKYGEDANMFTSVTIN